MYENALDNLMQA